MPRKPPALPSKQTTTWKQRQQTAWQTCKRKAYYRLQGIVIRDQAVRKEAMRVLGLIFQNSGASVARPAFGMSKIYCSFPSTYLRFLLYIM